MAIAVNTAYTSFSYIGTGTSGGTVMTNITSSAAAYDYFPDNAVVDDAIYFGWNQGRWDSLKLHVGTALVADAITLVWEYWDASAWTTLAVTDNTNGFTVLGTNTVEFTPPNDFYAKSIAFSGSTKQNTLWIRCRISAVTNITEGGAQSTNAAQHKYFEILVTGDYSGSTDIFKQIYDADQAGGWGHTALTERGIQINCNLTFGRDAATEVNTQKEVVSVKYDHVRINSPTIFTSGLLDGAGWTSGGSKIEFGSKGADFTMAQNGATVKMYDTQIVQSGETGGTGRIWFRGDGNFQDVIFERFSRFCPGSNNFNLKRVKIKGGRWFGNAVGTIDDVIVQSNSGNAMTLYSGITARGLQVESSAATPYRNFLAIGTMIDCEVSDDPAKWTFYITSDTHTTSFKQTFNLKVVDAGNNDIGGAAARLVNKDGTEIFNLSTAADGTITEQEILKVIFNRLTSSTVTKIDYNPFTLTIKKAGYQTYISTFTIDAPIDWNITLKHSNICVDQEVMLS